MDWTGNVGLMLGRPDSEVASGSQENWQMEPNFAYYEIRILNIWQKWQAMPRKVGEMLL